jgi:hypothetical protein
VRALDRPVGVALALDELAIVRPSPAGRPSVTSLVLVGISSPTPWSRAPSSACARARLGAAQEPRAEEEADPEVGGQEEGRDGQERDEQARRAADDPEDHLAERDPQVATGAGPPQAGGRQLADEQRGEDRGEAREHGDHEGLAAPGGRRAAAEAAVALRHGDGGEQVGPEPQG